MPRINVDVIVRPKNHCKSCKFLEIYESDEMGISWDEQRCGLFNVHLGPYYDKPRSEIYRQAPKCVDALK